jgi:hypothetical protein
MTARSFSSIDHRLTSNADLPRPCQRKEKGYLLLIICQSLASHLFHIALLYSHNRLLDHFRIDIGWIISGREGWMWVFITAPYCGSKVIFMQHMQCVRSWLFGLWYDAVSWVITNVLEELGASINSARWVEVNVGKTSDHLRVLISSLR